MEPENQTGTVVTKRHWQLRWGHILMALFIIVLVVIAYVVIHQIKTADKASQTCLTTNSCSNGAGKNHTSTSKTPASSGSKTSKNKSSSTPASTPSNKSKSTSPATATPSPTSTSTNNSATGTTNNSVPKPTTNSSALADTGPGDTIGLFVGTVIAGTAFHYFYTKRRLGLTK